MKAIEGLLLVMLLALAACSGDLSEVDTNSGGTLDCPSDTVLYASIDPVPSASTPTPSEALGLVGDEFLPPGTPDVESQNEQEAVFLFRDTDGNRVGRVIVAERGGTGWLPQATERCG